MSEKSRGGRPSLDRYTLKVARILMSVIIAFIITVVCLSAAFYFFLIQYDFLSLCGHGLNRIDKTYSDEPYGIFFTRDST